MGDKFTWEPGDIRRKPRQGNVKFEHDGKTMSGRIVGERPGSGVFVIVPTSGKAPRSKQGPYQHRVSGVDGFVALIPTDKVT